MWAWLPNMPNIVLGSHWPNGAGQQTSSVTIKNNHAETARTFITVLCYFLILFRL